jgi:hypothetical protein
MAIALFKYDNKLRTLRVQNKQKHRVDIRITDTRDPTATRWYAQRAVQRAASFKANKGFDDDLARTGGWHSFKVSHTRIARFARDIGTLVAMELVEVEIDNVAMRRRIAAVGR